MKKRLELAKLTKKQLIHLIVSYDNYIREHEEPDFFAGWRPVCLEEFYDNDYSLNN